MATPQQPPQGLPAAGHHLQGDSVDDIQGVDDIAQRLAHLPAMGIAHNGVQVDLRREGAVWLCGSASPPGPPRLCPASHPTLNLKSLGVPPAPPAPSWA